MITYSLSYLLKMLASNTFLYHLIIDQISLYQFLLNRCRQFWINTFFYFILPCVCCCNCFNPTDKDLEEQSDTILTKSILIEKEISTTDEEEKLLKVLQLGII